MRVQPMDDESPKSSETLSRGAAGAVTHDQTLDLLRGALICMVVVEHVGWRPSLFEIVTHRGRLFASAAEGFLIISGVLVGRVRGAQARAGHLALATERLLRRAAILALYTTAITLILHTVGL